MNYDKVHQEQTDSSLYSTHKTSIYLIKELYPIHPPESSRYLLSAPCLPNDQSTGKPQIDDLLAGYVNCQKIHRNVTTDRSSRYQSTLVMLMTVKMGGGCDPLGMNTLTQSHYESAVRQENGSLVSDRV